MSELCVTRAWCKRRISLSIRRSLDYHEECFHKLHSYWLGVHNKPSRISGNHIWPLVKKVTRSYFHISCFNVSLRNRIRCTNCTLILYVLLAGDITQKGYEKKRTRLLAPYAPKQTHGNTTPHCTVQYLVLCVTDQVVMSDDVLSNSATSAKPVRTNCNNYSSAFVRAIT